MTPRGAAIYYRRLTKAPVRPFPLGLRMVAGNSHAVRPQSQQVTYWDCAVFKENFYAPRQTAERCPLERHPRTARSTRTSSCT